MAQSNARPIDQVIIWAHPLYGIHSFFEFRELIKPRRKPRLGTKAALELIEMEMRENIDRMARERKTNALLVLIKTKTRNKLLVPMQGRLAEYAVAKLGERCVVLPPACATSVSQKHEGRVREFIAGKLKPFEFAENVSVLRMGELRRACPETANTRICWVLRNKFNRDVPSARQLEMRRLTLDYNETVGIFGARLREARKARPIRPKPLPHRA
jgi:hypothetical protein